MNAIVWTVTVVVGLPVTGAAVVALVWLFQPATGPGLHQAVEPDETTRAALFFRRAIAAVRRRLPVPAELHAAADLRTAGAATVLLANRNAAALGSSFRISLTPEEETAALDAGQPVLRDRTLSEVRAERNAGYADVMSAGYARAVDRLRQEAGLPTVAQMQAMRAGSPQWAFPPLDEPPSPEPEPRGPVHDTRMDLYAPHYAPDVPAYGQAPVARVLEAERLGRVMTP